LFEFIVLLRPTFPTNAAEFWILPESELKTSSNDMGFTAIELWLTSPVEGWTISRLAGARLKCSANV